MFLVSVLLRVGLILLGTYLLMGGLLFIIYYVLLPVLQTPARDIYNNDEERLLERQVLLKQIACKAKNYRDYIYNIYKLPAVEIETPNKYFDDQFLISYTTYKELRSGQI